MRVSAGLVLEAIRQVCGRSPGCMCIVIRQLRLSEVESSESHLTQTLH